MLVERRRLLREALAWADVATLGASMALAYGVATYGFHRRFEPLSRNGWALALSVPIWLLCLRGAGLYRSHNYYHAGRLLGRLFNAQASGALLLLSSMYLTRSEVVSRLLLQAFLLISFVLLAGQKLTLAAILKRMCRRKPVQRRKVVLIAEAEQAVGCLELMGTRVSMLADVVAVLTPGITMKVSADGTVPVRGTIDDLPGLLSSQVVDEVVVAAPCDAAMIERMGDWCAVRGIMLRIWVQARRPAVGVWTAEYLSEGAFLLSLATVPRNPVNLALKRAMDVATAGIGLVLCGAAYLWYGRRLRRETGGSVLFHQQRVGRNGRPFTLHKFRTMGVAAEDQRAALGGLNQMNGAMFKIEHDPRITRTGRKLRRRYFDELPQFWNVLRGEMSLVGTRPPTCEETALYRDHHRRRLSMKPGITGLWQLSGNRTVKEFEDVVKLDCEYIDHWSLWLDVTIVARTVSKIFRGDGW